MVKVYAGGGSFTSLNLRIYLSCLALGFLPEL
jgi:hypothetical protein